MGSFAVLSSTAENAEKRLVDFYLFRKTGMDDAEREPMKQIVLVEGADHGRAAALVDLLLHHGVEVQRATAGFSSAKAEEAFALADRIGVMHQGRLLECGPPDALYMRPGHALRGDVSGCRKPAARLPNAGRHTLLAARHTRGSAA